MKGQTWEVAEQTEVNGKWEVRAVTRARWTERGWFGEEATVGTVCCAPLSWQSPGPAGLGCGERGPYLCGFVLSLD